MRDLWVTSNQVQPIPYSEFLQHLKAGRLESIKIGSQFIEGKLKAPTADGRTRVVTTRVAPELGRELSQYDVRFEGVVESTLLNELLSWVVPGLLLLAFWTFMSKRMTGQGSFGGLLSVGKSRAKLHSETDVKVSFDDVAGVDEAKAELRESVEFLKNPRPTVAWGPTCPRGCCWWARPAPARRCWRVRWPARRACPFSASPVRSSSRCSSAWVQRACATCSSRPALQAPAIIFIDELDALGRARGVGGRCRAATTRSEQTLNQLLAEMDGFDASTGVVILAATNRPEILDPALLRAGRFDRQVLVDRPDRKGRADVLRVHLKKVTLDVDIDPDAVARADACFAGAGPGQPGQRGGVAGPRGAVPTRWPWPTSLRRSNASWPAWSAISGCSHPTSAVPSHCTRWATPWWR